MDVIRFSSTGGAVSFDVTIVGVVVWRYRYEADGTTFIRKSSDGQPPPHALGMPQELRGDVNGWDVHVVSPDEKERSYRIELSWRQDGQVIHSWKRKGRVKENKPVTQSGSAFLLEATR